MLHSPDHGPGAQSMFGSKRKTPHFMGCFPFGIRQCPTLPGVRQPPSSIRGARIVAASPLLAIPDVPPACFRHWRRQAPVPPDAAMASPSQVQCCTHQITARACRACSVPKGKHPIFMGCFPFGIRQCPTLPGRHQPSTIGAERLNFCVRYGNRWIPFAITTGMP